MKTRQDEARKHEIKVGVTVLIGLIVLVLAILSVGQQRGILQNRYRLRAMMSRVNGLQTGAPVRLAGVRVGTVVDVAFPDDITDQKIEIALEIDKTVQARIRHDSQVHIGTLGLLGDKFIGITMGSLDQPVLKNNDLISSSDPIDVEKLLDEGVVILNDFKKTSKTVNEITDKINSSEGTLGLMVNDPRLYFELDSFLNLLEKLSARLERSEGNVARMLEDSSLYLSAVDLVKSATFFADSLRHGQGSFPRMLRDPEILDNIAETAHRLNSIVKKIELGEGTLGQAVTNKELYQDLVRVSREIDSLIKDIRKNPQRYLKVEIF